MSKKLPVSEVISFSLTGVFSGKPCTLVPLKYINNMGRITFLAFIYCIYFFSNGFCQCPQGQNRGPCKHKQAVSKFHGAAEFSILPYNDANKCKSSIPLYCNRRNFRWNLLYRWFTKIWWMQFLNINIYLKVPPYY